jgi:hypothetical protein
MVPAAEHQKVADALISSRANGIALADALDNAGILVTDARRAELRREALLTLQVLLEAESPEGIVRWHTGGTNVMSPKEMFYAMSAWLEQTIELIMRPRDEQDPHS